LLALRRTRYLVSSPPSGPILHAATYLHRSPGWSHARRFSRLNRDVETQLETAPGALAYTLQRLLIGREVWTLSLWSDRNSMLAFVRSGSHRSAAEWLRATEENLGKFAQWEAVHPSLNLDEAFDRLGSPRPTGRVLMAPTPIPAGWRSVPR
jgi:heme-degrading monooxygenase HmoA